MTSQGGKNDCDHSDFKKNVKLVISRWNELRSQCDSVRVKIRLEQNFLIQAIFDQEFCGGFIKLFSGFFRHLSQFKKKTNIKRANSWFEKYWENFVLRVQLQNIIFTSKSYCVNYVSTLYGIKQKWDLKNYGLSVTVDLV